MAMHAMTLLHRVTALLKLKSVSVHTVCKQPRCSMAPARGFSNTSELSYATQLQTHSGFSLQSQVSIYAQP